MDFPLPVVPVIRTRPRRSCAILEILYVATDVPEHHPHNASLSKHVRPESADSGYAHGEIVLTLRLEVLALVRSHELLDDFRRIIRFEHPVADKDDLPVNTVRGRAAYREVYVRSTTSYCVFKDLLDCEHTSTPCIELTGNLCLNGQRPANTTTINYTVRRKSLSRKGVIGCYTDGQAPKTCGFARIGAQTGGFP